MVVTGDRNTFALIRLMAETRITTNKTAGNDVLHDDWTAHVILPLQTMAICIPPAFP